MNTKTLILIAVGLYLLSRQRSASAQPAMPLRGPSGFDWSGWLADPNVA